MIMGEETVGEEAIKTYFKQQTLAVEVYPGLSLKRSANQSYLMTCSSLMYYLG